MRLLSFRVKNFRSIIDSREVELSNDNVNVLIGQNESGKSSLLEGLNTIQTKNIEIDDLRIDNENPIITCKYKFDNIEEIKEYIEDEGYIFSSKIIKELEDRNLEISIDFLYKGDEFIAYTFSDQEFTLFFESLEDELSIIEEESKREESIQKEDGTVETKVVKDKYLKKEREFIEIVYDFSPDIILFEDDSLLPSRIDIDDLKNEKSVIKGKKWVNNFLKLLDIKISDLELYNGEKQRFISTKIESFCEDFSNNFSNFWTQTLGKKDKISIIMEVNSYGVDSDKPGELYLSFWIKDKNGRNKPEQRSKGVRWYISFYLQMKYFSKNFEDISRVILIDEPGANLHAQAQKDILKMFDSTSKNFQVIYATHSPFLIDIEKIYRILAVERIEEKNGKSHTVVFNFHKLGQASEDTLTPLYTHMGVSLGHQQVIKEKHNIVIEEPSAFFYFKAILKLIDYTDEIYFLPATGVSKIPKLCNLLLGWGIDFGILIDDDTAGRKVYKEVTEKLLILDKEKVVKLKGCDGVEDLFSKKDFTKYILQEKKTIGDIKISDFLKKNKGYSKVVLAKNFLINVEKGKFKIDNFSKTTIDKFNKLIEDIKKLNS